MSEDKYKKIDEKVSRQTQEEQPGIESKMNPTPIYNDENYIGSRKLAVKYMQDGDVIVNTSSITAYNGSPGLIDYASTKGAITSFTRSLALNLADKGIRVNAVAPGPIWTPLIPATFDAEKVQEHGSDTPLKRRGQPAENAPAYVFLVSSDSSYMTGQTIHVDGGDFVGS